MGWVCEGREIEKRVVGGCDFVETLVQQEDATTKEQVNRDPDFASLFIYPGFTMDAYFTGTDESSGGVPISCPVLKLDDRPGKDYGAARGLGVVLVPSAIPGSEEETLGTDGSLEDADVRVSSTAPGLELDGGFCK